VQVVEQLPGRLAGRAQPAAEEQLRVEPIANRPEARPVQRLCRGQLGRRLLDGAPRELVDQRGHAGRLLEPRLDVQLAQLHRAQPRL
jgi:hypothetical protein